MLTAVASDAGVTVILVIPARDTLTFDLAVQEITHQYELNPLQDEFVHLPTANLRRGEQIMKARDRRVIELAETLIPVSLRPGSSLEELIESKSMRGKRIVDDHRIPYEKRKNSLAYRIAPTNLNPDLASVSGRYLIHWTRSFHHKWPGEKQIDYYRDMCRRNTYPRSAIDSLRRILSTRNIHASSTHMPAGHKCVSFSARQPEELLPLIAWRARYRQMAFEPYGVGIVKDLASKLDIHPVHYGPGADSDTPRWLMQSTGRITDWRQEREYRHLGDFDLRAVAREDLIAFTHTAEEALTVQCETGVRTIPFVR